MTAAPACRPGPRLQALIRQVAQAQHLTLPAPCQEPRAPYVPVASFGKLLVHLHAPVTRHHLYRWIDQRRSLDTLPPAFRGYFLPSPDGRWFFRHEHPCSHKTAYSIALQTLEPRIRQLAIDRHWARNPRPALQVQQVRDELEATFGPLPRQTLAQLLHDRLKLPRSTIYRHLRHLLHQAAGTPPFTGPPRPPAPHARLPVAREDYIVGTPDSRRQISLMI